MMTATMASEQRAEARRPWAAAATAVVGGALLAAGAALPWFTLFAGLHRYPGLVSISGQALAIGGLLGALAGVLLLWPAPRAAGAARAVLTLLGVPLVGYAAYLLVGLRATMQALAEQPLAVPAMGPGLFVAALGALLVAAAPWLRRRAPAPATLAGR